jgi:hypothetical protein
MPEAVVLPFALPRTSPRLPDVIAEFARRRLALTALYAYSILQAEVFLSFLNPQADLLFVEAVALAPTVVQYVNGKLHRTLTSAFKIIRLYY